MYAKHSYAINEDCETTRLPDNPDTTQIGLRTAVSDKNLSGIGPTTHRYGVAFAIVYTSDDKRL